MEALVPLVDGKTRRQGLDLEFGYRYSDYTPSGSRRHLEGGLQLAADRHVDVPRDAATRGAGAERRRAREPGGHRPRQRDTGSMLDRERRRNITPTAAAAVHLDGHVGRAGRHGRGHRGGPDQHLRRHGPREPADDRARGHDHGRLRLDAGSRRAAEPGVLARLLRHRHRQPDRRVRAAGDPRRVLPARRSRASARRSNASAAR